MKNLDVYKSRFFEGKTIMVHHVYNTENANEDSTGIWFAFGDLTDAEMLGYAKLHVAPELQINIKIIAQ